MLMRDSIPAMVRRNLSLDIGHQRYLPWLVSQYKVNKFLLLAVALDIKFGGNDLFQFKNIIIANMPFVGPGMYGNPLCAEPFAIFSYLYQIQIIAPARIS